MITERMNRINVRYSIYITCVVCIIMCLPGMRNNAHAHKVNIFAYAEDGWVYSEAYFVDGSKCKDAQVEIFDSETGESLLQGRTDDQGRFSFTIPELTSLKLVLDTGTGHRNDYIVSEGEVREAMGAASAKTEQPEHKAAAVDAGNRTASNSAAGTDRISLSDIEKIVDESMDRKLKPVTGMLVRIQEKIEKPGITEIIGGIGYIIGLMGIAMYYKSRRSEDLKR